MDKDKVQIKDWIENVINGTGGFKTYESREIVDYPDREIGIAEFVIKSLVNPFCDGSDDVLDAIVKRRKSFVEELERKQTSIL